MTDTTEILTALDAKIAAIASELNAAKLAAQSVPRLMADLERLEAAKKALAAPQTPEGRKRIGDGQRRRKKADAPRPILTCDECHGGLTAVRAGTDCPEDGCEGILHNDCMAAHKNRWHSVGQEA